MAIDPSNKEGYQTLVWTMAATIAFMIYIVFIHPGIALDQNEKPAAAQEIQK